VGGLISARQGQFERIKDTEAHSSDDQLSGVKVPTWIVNGDRDAIIKREDTDHKIESGEDRPDGWDSYKVTLRKLTVQLPPSESNGAE
jgi:hypothetical protein